MAFQKPTRVPTGHVANPLMNAVKDHFKTEGVPDFVFTDEQKPELEKFLATTQVLDKTTGKIVGGAGTSLAGKRVRLSQAKWLRSDFPHSAAGVEWWFENE
jgi:hypothetical protein